MSLESAFSISIVDAYANILLWSNVEVNVSIICGQSTAVSRIIWYGKDILC